ncbi:Beta-TrCP [Arthrobotrys entomopaga]|nr:Beta-TrCP [Arthrobotrys entomopaga]
MDPLSVTASIIAVIQGINGCCKLYSSVKDAKEDISKLHAEVASIDELITQVEALVRGPNGQRFSGSGELEIALKGCYSELQQPKDKLTSKGTKERKFLNFIKTHVKWPFTHSEVSQIVGSLERWKQSITLALNIDQTVQLRNINRKLDFSSLPVADGAAYGSFVDQHQPECLQGTRVSLLHNITTWAEDPQGKSIFWLSGAAGTGKSTISRTVAKQFRDKDQLAASFFFRRGEKDRGDAAKFFTTLASQLANCIRDMAPSIQNAIDEEPSIPSKGLKEQFSKLIFEPLSQLRCLSHQALKAILVVDALDECDDEKDQQLIISLLGRLKELRAVDIRIFLTSRPELPVRLGFKELSAGTYQDIILHEVPGIEQDITLFLEKELVEIRGFHQLPNDWPGENDIQRLVKMAVPLFIFAATACRFIGDRKRDPVKRIAIVMGYQTDWRAGKLEQTYLPILHSLASDDITEGISDPQDSLAEEFREIVGTILSLASPLSVTSLSGLLCIAERVIDRILEPLHSVLDIPTLTNRRKPVRTFHLSFRDFLFDQQLSHHNKFHHFWIDEKNSHRMIYKKCLDLISSPKGLRENICGLKSLGTLRQGIETSQIESSISSELRYACRYWIYHLEQSKDTISDDDTVHGFLQKYLLHWLEAMNLSDGMTEIIPMVDTLNLRVHVENGKNISAFIYDVKRFVLQNQYIIGKAPLQVYYSALIFAPKNSLVRCAFKPEESIKWIKQLPWMQDEWDGVLQTLHGHTTSVHSIAFSPDGKILASSSYDGEIKIWNADTGAELSTIQGHTGNINRIVFLPDWNELNTLHGHKDPVSSLSFAPDSKIITAVSFDTTIKLWDPIRGTELNTLYDESRSWISSVEFSPNSKMLVSASEDGLVKLWDVVTGARFKVMSGHSSSVNSVAFSPNGKTIASASGDGSIKLWDAATNTKLNIPRGQASEVHELEVSPDGKTILSIPYKGPAKLWNVVTGVALHTINRSDIVSAATFSPDSKIVGLSSYNVPNVSKSMTKFWSTTTGTELNTLYHDSVPQELWSWATGVKLHNLSENTGLIKDVQFSSDGQKIGSASDDRTIRLWTIEGAELNILRGHTSFAFMISFSPDGNTIASISYDKTIRLWDAVTGETHNVITTKSYGECVRFSEDGSYVNNGYESFTIDGTSIPADSLIQWKGNQLHYYDYFDGDEWLVVESNRCIWLPTDRRSCCSAVHRNTAVLGHKSGLVSFFTFDSFNPIFTT